MQIIKQHKIIDSPWRHFTDDEVLTGDAVIVSASRWQGEREWLIAVKIRIGVRLAVDVDVNHWATELPYLDLIALDFTQFAEGRGYSQARLLRDNLSYRGEIRALGARRDHLLTMERCGIDAFEMESQENIADALAAFEEISVAYQPTLAATTTVMFQQL